MSSNAGRSHAAVNHHADGDNLQSVHSPSHSDLQKPPKHQASLLEEKPKRPRSRDG